MLGTCFNEDEHIVTLMMVLPLQKLEMNAQTPVDFAYSKKNHLQHLSTMLLHLSTMLLQDQVQMFVQMKKISLFEQRMEEIEIVCGLVRKKHEDNVTVTIMMAFQHLVSEQHAWNLVGSAYIKMSQNLQQLLQQAPRLLQ